MNTPKQTDKLVVAALYQFTEIYDLPQKQSDLLSICRSRNVRGTLILATEGINGTISGRGHHIKTVIQHIIDWPEIADLDVKYSSSTDQNFNRVKVKIKKEIVRITNCKLVVNISFKEFVEVADERLGKDEAYLLNSQKIRNELGWTNQITLESGVFQTIEWLDENLDVLCEQPDSYIHKT